MLSSSQSVHPSETHEAPSPVHQKKTLATSPIEMSNSVNEDQQQSENVRRIIASLSAGAAAGACAKTVIAPLDRTKIYFQTHPEKSYRIRGAVKFLKLTYQNDGFFRLWRGNSATMARVIPYAAIQFAAHEQYKRFFKIDAASVRSGTNHSVYLHLIAGSMAGVTGQAMTYPLDRARAVMAVTRMGEYRNLSDVFRSIVKNEGVLSLYRGFVPTMIGVIPYAGVSFFTFESLKKYFTKRASQIRPDSPYPSPVERMISGATAGLLGQTASYPLDIVRRRMQTACQMGVSKNLYSSVIGTLLYVLKKEGILRGWYKGLSMNFIKGPLAAGTSFTTYDYLRMGFQKLLALEPELH